MNFGVVTIPSRRRSLLVSTINDNNYLNSQTKRSSKLKIPSLKSIRKAKYTLNIQFGKPILFTQQRGDIDLKLSHETLQFLKQHYKNPKSTLAKHITQELLMEFLYPKDIKLIGIRASISNEMIE